MKYFIYLVFIVLYAGVTFFGLGPVLLADGTLQERFLTLGIVILTYITLTGLLIWYRSNMKKRS